MRLKIGIVDEFARADPGAVDHEIEFRIDIFQFPETNTGINRAAGLLKAVREVVEIDSGVHQRDAEREAGRKARTGNI